MVGALVRGHNPICLALQAQNPLALFENHTLRRSFAGNRSGGPEGLREPVSQARQTADHMVCDGGQVVPHLRPIQNGFVVKAHPVQGLDPCAVAFQFFFGLGDLDLRGDLETAIRPQHVLQPVPNLHRVLGQRHLGQVPP